MAKRAKAQRNVATPADKHLSETQLKKLLRYVKNKADLARQRGTTRAIIDELIILLLINTGLRAGELCTLNIRDLPVEHGENAIWVRDAKANVTREIEITSKTAMYLERFVKLYRKGAKPAQPLLTGERGRRFIYMSLYSKVKRIGENAGIGRLHSQMLRHTFLVRLYNVERDLRFVQNQAGHASPKTTAIYAKTDNEYKRKLRITDIECEGCGALIPPATGTKIDSGQSLCDNCLEELRKSYSEKTPPEKMPQDEEEADQAPQEDSSQADQEDEEDTLEDSEE